MFAIYKRELRASFNSMIGCVFIAFLVAFTGIYFMAYNINYGYPYFGYCLQTVAFMYLIAIPILTMRSFAEDRKNKTDQLLLTAPVSLIKVVLGKYLAMVSILAIPNVIYLIFPLIIKSGGTAYIMDDYLAILTFFLLGCVYIAVGMFISSLTESQILAAIGSFAALLVLYLWSGIIGFLPSSKLPNAVGVALLITFVVFLIYEMNENWFICGILELIGLIAVAVVYFVKSKLYEDLLSNILGKFDLYAPLSNVVTNHMLDITGWIMYLSLIFLFIVLTVEMIQKRRWS